MKAFQIVEYAHPSKIQVATDVPVPKPGKGEVLIDVHAAGLNFFDILQAQGKYQTQPPMPFVLGAEFSGTISADSPIPKHCPYKPGDRVFGYAQGAYGEHVVANPFALIPLPDNVSFEQAAVVPLTYTTSYEGLVHRGKIQPGEWVLVHAAAGGVGLAACQIAKLMGCKVIATASSDIKRAVCIDHAGVDAVVDYTKKDWQKEVMKITDGKGVNVVYDPVGMILPSLKCVAWNSRLVVVGFAAGTIEKIPANLLLLKQASVVGLFWGGGTTRDPQHAVQVVSEVLGLLSSGKLKPILYEKVYNGLETVSEALQDLEGRKTWGKGVIRIRPSTLREAKL
ncbi:NAD(P)-binding protein [Papiliotrema laurentii]|uniref:NAD(P)-binding protein n=1 Tax=Papiliotrema laurentii TaxID=5418 RepID=A0AAD9CYK5_PAPLA|nr:NAD(P)-binding protein [Papiliotrema laurentii]